MMTERTNEPLSLETWADLMGRDLPEAECQVLQPVRIEGGKLKLFSGMVNRRIAAGTKIGGCLRENRLVVSEAADGPEVQEAGWWDDGKSLEIELPEAVRAALPEGEQVACLLVERGNDLELRPVRVEEHEPDVLGPRIIDEVREADEGRPPEIVRHVVKGPDYEEWSAARVAELAGVVSAHPFTHDPLAPLSGGDDWIAWKTRKEILDRPEPDDDALRRRLESGVFAEQREDGSWNGHVVRTAYGIHRALSVDVSPDDARLQRAAQWLVDQPEPDGRPGMWMLDEARLRKWDARMRGEEEVEWLEFMVHHYTEEDHDLFRAPEPQQIIPTCTRNHHAGCDAMLHPSATAAMALCGCGHAEHPRLLAYANSMYQLSAMFGYFCACWGILGKDREVEDIRDRLPDFDSRADERPIALAAVPYGHGRDAEDLCALALLPRYPDIHRPDLSDTNGWTPYTSRDLGQEGYLALDGAYWQNADCWAKPNRALAQLPGWSGSLAEFFAVFQCHLYQTCLGEWNQGYPSGIFRQIAEVTRATRARHGVEGAPLACFAASRLLRTVPWLRHHQKDDGLWHFDELPRHGDQGRPPSPRLGTYHVCSVLHEFGLLDPLLPR